MQIPQNYINNILFVIRRLINKIYQHLFFVPYIKFGGSYNITGRPKIEMKRGSSFIVGGNFSLNSGFDDNLIGRQQQSIFYLGDNSEIIIGKDTGMSSIVIICMKKVIIGNNVKVGGNTVIYDTDFHSLNYLDRRIFHNDFVNRIDKEILIGNDVFIGAHSTILKGVAIGDRAIIGSCSVVTKNIPPNEIWGGNPAKFIRKIK